MTPHLEANPVCRAFLHLPGIGPVRERQLREQGIQTWQELLAAQTWPLPAKLRPGIEQVIQDSLPRLAADDLSYLCQTLRPVDHWRILAQWFPQASYFDIETTGMGWDSAISMIACYHQGQLYYFYEHENLDDFLELLPQIQLLVSFNGASFDVPRVLDYFHVPELPCAHLDLRWLCYHQAYRGGLKAIADCMGIQRPADIQTLAGDDAIELWKAWRASNVRAYRTRLTRYCAADVVMLPMVAAIALQAKGYHVEGPQPCELWDLLPPPEELPAEELPATQTASGLTQTALRRSRLRFFR